jgi:putative ABC transport system substrate-binding protein
VIGYNSFFTRSGAFFSFEFDYESLGKQAGEVIASYLETGECRENSPVFDTVINQKITDKIGIQVAE